MAHRLVEVAKKLAERHSVNSGRIIEWANQCGIDLSDILIEEKLFQAETEAFNYAVETLTCPVAPPQAQVDYEENPFQTFQNFEPGRRRSTSSDDIRYDFRF